MFSASGVVLFNSCTFSYTLISAASLSDLKTCVLTFTTAEAESSALCTQFVNCHRGDTGLL